MGTILIIKGADFSENAVAKEQLPYSKVVSSVFLKDGQKLAISGGVIKADSKVIFDVTLASNSSTTWFIAVGYGLSLSGSFAMSRSSAGVLQYGFKKSSTPSYAGSISTGRHVFDITRTSLTVDGVTKAEGEDFNHGDLPGKLNLLSLDTGGNLQHKFHSLKIYSDNGVTLTHNLIPVLDLGGKACLYNKVDGSFIYATDEESLDYDE